ncbi:MAG: RNA polymerase sigma-70 factor [Bacteroidota bacterium]
MAYLSPVTQVSQEHQLIDQMQDDDRSAFRSIFAEHYQNVCRTIHRYIVDPGLTEDLAQEVFVRFWQKRHQLTISSNLPAYLRRMAVNEALAHLRKKTRFQADELPIHLPGYVASAADEQLDASDLQQRINAAVAELPDRCRLVFELSRYEELSNKEIAEQLGISVKTVENQMTKALKSLRTQLAEYLGTALLMLYFS